MLKLSFAKISVLALAGTLVATPLLAAEDNGDGTNFVTTISDLPLMQGLETIADKDVLFETPGGRIAETTAQGSVAVTDVYVYYARILPQLGWQKTYHNSWSRQGEDLRVEASAENGMTTVKFSEKPLTEK
jgi:hypothetical protein